MASVTACPSVENGAAWDHMRPLLENPDLKPTPEQIGTSSEIAMDFLRVRSSSRLFTLGGAELINQKVTFPNSGPRPWMGRS